MEFVGSNIYGATGNARIAIQVGAAGSVGIVAGIDARGVGLQAETSGLEQRVANPVVARQSAWGATILASARSGVSGVVE